MLQNPMCPSSILLAFSRVLTVYSRKQRQVASAVICSFEATFAKDFSMQLLSQASGSCLQRSSFSTPCRSPVLPSSVSRHSRRQVLVLAQDKKTTGNATIDNALEVGGNLVESAASLVPDSVPRGVAKGGVAVAGALVAFWILQKLVSTVLTVALLGGAAWFYFQYGGSSDDSSKRSSGSSSSKDVDLNDPLAEARRIMDKYKK